MTSIIIPCYNSKFTISNVVYEIHEYGKKIIESTRLFLLMIIRVMIHGTVFSIFDMNMME